MTLLPRTDAPRVGWSSDAVRVGNLTKAYGRHVAVDHISFGVALGEVVGFLGPNGAGKTTVLRVLTGALRASSGEVRVLGHHPFTEPVPVHERLGYLPGDLRLPAHLTGAQVLDLCSATRHRPSVDRSALVDQLEIPLDLPVAAMSKGNRQKLAVAQAFMGRPEVLLLDEPSSGLDPLAQEVLEELVRRAAGRGAAVLLSSHVLREVQEVAARVVLLRRGTVVASARLDELRATAPHDVRVHVDDPGVTSQLQHVAGVAGLTTKQGRISLTATTESLDAVLGILAGHHVRDLRITPADLETLFLRFYERA